MSKVVGKTLADVVVIRQRLEHMLEDGRIRYCAYRLQHLAEIVRALSADAQDVRAGIEYKLLFGFREIL